ncbi:MAG: Mrp/NBP35 family ATP-binding protein [Eubacteriales bacterium]|nr:Mrp/NBP35 family ATP-binding protein [Eubacteriales bacterium]
MENECNHNCETCTQKCEISKDAPNAMSSIKKVIAVMSGKGGVGKSMIASALAVLTQRKGYNCAVLDADITGPSIPKSFGINDKAIGTEVGILPNLTKTGLQVASINLMLEDDTQPVVWRGPVIAGAVKQFWTDVIWNNVDVMYIDMPPGTGDVPLTVLQSIPVDGIVVVTSPQTLVSMVVEKAIKMAGMLNVPIVGVVENMSYYMCPNCGSKHSIFGKSSIDELAKRYQIQNVCRLPIDPKFAAAADEGLLELIDMPQLDNLVEAIIDKN